MLILQRIDNSYLPGQVAIQSFGVCELQGRLWYRGVSLSVPRVAEPRDVWKRQPIRLEESPIGSAGFGGTP